MEYRMGGLEKQPGSGNVSYAPQDHEAMCRLRADKVKRIAAFLPEIEITGPQQAALLVLGWGGSYGAVAAAVQRARHKGLAVAHAHLRYLNPFPSGLGEVLERYDKVLIPELNAGQLALLIRARYLVDAESFSRLQGRPFTIAEIETRIEELLS
jgi:2-oxoglutarate ferredoxin oxidoreductase subunit alpha